MKTFLLLAITTFLVFFAFSCKKTNPSEPIYQNRVIVGWGDTTSNGELMPHDSMTANHTFVVAFEVEKTLVNGTICIFGIDVTHNDTIFLCTKKNLNGNYFDMRLYLGTLKIMDGNYIAKGFVLNPDTIWLTPQSFVIYRP